MKKLNKIMKTFLSALAGTALLAAMAIPVLADSAVMPTDGGTLHITKYVQDSGNGTQNATGMEEDDPHGIPVANIQYYIYKVEGVVNNGSVSEDAYPSLPISLTGTGKNVTSLTDKKGKTFQTTYVTEGKTAENGKLDVSLKESAVYMVVEDVQSASDDATWTDSKGEEHVGDLTAGNPFLVPVPMTNPTGTGWMTDVYVFPKNENSGIVKKEDKPSVNVGEVETFQMYSVIRQSGLDTDGNILLEKMNLVDKLDTALTFVDPEKNITLEMTTDDVATASAEGATSTYEKLTYGTDYTVEVVEQTVTVSLTEAGIKKIYAATGDKGTYTYKALRLSLQATVNELIRDENHQLLMGKNEFSSVTKNQGSDEVTIGSNKVYFHTGRIAITKVDSSDKSKVLAGASFKIASSEENAKKGVFIRKDNQGKILLSDGEGYKEAKDYEVTTDAQGKAYFEGLSCCDGKSVTRSYWIVETAVPKGYKLIATEPIKVTFGPHDMTGETALAEAVEVAVTVFNAPETKTPPTPQTPPRVVKTGDLNNVLPYIVVGVGALLLIIVLLVRRKKQN